MQSYTQKLISLSSFLLLSITLLSCSKNEVLHSISGSTMGTTYSVKFTDEAAYSEAKLNLIKSEIDSILFDINQQMSTYIPDSEISQFNNFNDTSWFKVSPDFAKVVQKSIEIGKATNGALDITVGPLVNLWGFGSVDRERKIPSEEEINLLVKEIGLTNIEVDQTNSALKKQRPNLIIDLSATAKGYGVDKVFGYLKLSGFTDFMVEIGGEVRAIGKNHKDESWKIGIANPESPTKPQHVLEIEEGAVATSGDYWNYFEVDGVRYSHTIDPRSGRPITHKLASVTVFAETCLKADGLATAINVMGPEEGYNFALENNIACYLIIRDETKFITKMTPAFEEIFKN